MTNFNDFTATFLDNFFMGNISFNYDHMEIDYDPLNLNNHNASNANNINTTFQEFSQSGADKTILITILTQKPAAQTEITAIGRKLQQQFLTPTWHLYLLQTPLNDFMLYNLILINHQQPCFIRPGYSIVHSLTKLITSNLFHNYANKYYSDSWFDNPKHHGIYQQIITKLTKLTYLLEPQDPMTTFRKQIANLTDQAAIKPVLMTLQQAYQAQIAKLQAQTAQVINAAANKSNPPITVIKSVTLLDLNTIFQSLKPQAEAINSSKNQKLQAILTALIK